jgi:hypothetical protein
VEYLVTDFRAKSVGRLDSFSLAPTNIALSNATVAENQPAGTLVGQLSATDPDNGGMFSFALVAGEGGTDNASFAISGSELRTARAFSFEARSQYNVRIRVTDPRGMSYEKSFAISVSDQPEQEFRVTGLSGDFGNAATLQWTCEAGYSYQVEYSDTLEGGDWHPLGVPQVWASGALTMSQADLATEGHPRRFYRVVRTALP